MYVKLSDIENQIHELVNKDVNNPEVFNKIYELCYECINRGKYKMNTPEETHDTAFTMAEDLYMKIYKGGEIHSWIGYINKSRPGYIRKYRTAYNTEIMDVTGDKSLEDSIISMSCGGSVSLSNDTYSAVYEESAIDSVCEIVDDLLDKKCKYYKDSSRYKNIYISILLSIVNEQFICYFINDEDIMYTRLMYNIIKTELSKLMYENMDNDLSISGKTLVQMFALGGIMGE